MLTMHQLQICQSKLHALQAELNKRASTLRAEMSSVADGDDSGGFVQGPADRGDLARQDSENAVSIGIAETEAILRQEIESALQRIEDRTFGICEECRAPISAERLSAIPYARYCVRCASVPGGKH
jgi:DnaK suppressor protein